MCGIVGYVGERNYANKYLMDGLKSLEYRGYDSAGIALHIEQKMQVVKTKGKVVRLEERLRQNKVPTASLGIAHTRWATHGEPTEGNAHPHQQGEITLVHNGIIENEDEIKAELKQNGYTFYSQTDSEVACAYFDYLYKRFQNKIRVLVEANRKFRGSFAFGIIFNDELDTIYAMRRNSPLILAINEEGNFIASDVMAIVKYAKQYILLGQDEFAKVKKDEILVYNQKGAEIAYTIQETTMAVTEIQKGGYEHFMLKEIHEEPQVVTNIITQFVQKDIDELTRHFPDLSKYKEIVIVACGSALYAGMVAKSLIEHMVHIKVHVEIASEFRYQNPILSKESLVLLISQSGETADTLAALQLARQQAIDTFAIVNVKDSSIAREADYILYTIAGPEIAVATTKAYCAQVTILSLLTLHLAYLHKQLTKLEANELIKELRTLPLMLHHMIHNIQYEQVANIISIHNNVFFIGRGLDYALSMEGSLKLKEISYIHSEAYAAGELKHGTISLIKKGTPVIVLATDRDVLDKTLSNCKEVKARGACVILICREDFLVNEDVYDHRISIPKVNILMQAIITAIPLQLLSYQIARLRGCEIDQPRNLAKSVTVE